MRWLYKQVILPSVSYSCFVWTHRIQENKSLRNLLEKIQKLATLHITGGLQKSPNITLDIIAGLMPIDVTLKFKAVSLTSLRLKVDNNWDGQYSLSSKVVSHARFLDQEINKLSIAKNINLIDKTTLTNFANKFTVNMNLPQVAPDDSNIKIYTDGSLRKSLNLTGAGFTMQRNGRTIVEQTIRLGKMATINQSEMFAINQAADLLVSADTQKQVIHFYSDSLSSLLQLNKGYTTSKLTLDTVLILNKLGIQNEMYLHKVAAHTSIPGNERADILAKEVANTPPIGPEPFLFISWSNVMNELLLKAKNERSANLQIIK